MKNRIPTKPGQVKLTPVDGQENTFTLTRDDAPTEAGTPLTYDITCYGQLYYYSLADWEFAFQSIVRNTDIINVTGASSVNATNIQQYGMVYLNTSKTYMTVGAIRTPLDCDLGFSFTCRY